MLGIELRLSAHASQSSFLASSAPLSSQIVLGLDLDPASTDDLRGLVSQTLARDGFVIAGIQQTESVSPPPPPHAANGAQALEASTPSTTRHSHSGHDHSGLKGNAYNFASSPAHAASFDLTQGQLSGLPCFRTAPSTPLGCVEAAHNWFASLCSLGAHVGTHAPLSNALLEFTSGWPIGTRLAERCVPPLRPRARSCDANSAGGEAVAAAWYSGDAEALAEPLDGLGVAVGGGPAIAEEEEERRRRCSHLDRFRAPRRSRSRGR